MSRRARRSGGWARGEQRVLGWLAGTATGSIVKMGLGALLAWVAQNATAMALPDWALAVIVVVVPLVINVLNPADGRYGVGKFEFDPDAVEGSEV